MSKSSFINRIIGCFILLFVCIFCLGAVNLNNYFTSAEISVDLGSYAELDNGLNKLYRQFGDIQNGDEIVINKDDIQEIDGEKYISTSKLSNEVSVMSTNSESLVEVSSLSQDYQIIEDDSTLTLKQGDYTNRIIVYYEGKLDNYNTDYYAEGMGWHIYQYLTKEDTQEAYEYYKSLDYVESVAYDDVVVASDLEESSTAASSNYLSWGVEYTGVDDFNSYLDFLYTEDELPTVYVPVLDSGVNTDHELLKDRIAFEYGKDFTDNADNSKGYLFEDYSGHGSHTAGIIANQTKSNVKIIPLKVLKENGKGTVSMILNAIQYVLYGLNGNENKNWTGEVYNLNCRVMNMSLGVESDDGSPVTNKSLENLVRTANSLGVLSVVSAGNSNFNVTACSPANVQEAIVVSALSESLTKAYYSNYGSTVDFCAPGSGIVSSYLGNDNSSNGYASMSGTSMAAPHVTAVFALLFSSPAYAKYSNDSLVEMLKSSAVDYGTAGWDQYYGYGCINLSNFGIETRGEVEFSVQEKNHTESFDLSLSFDTSYSYEIYYSLDESIPSMTSETSIKYTGPITLTKTTKVSAIAYAYNEDDIVEKSDIIVTTYYFNNIDLDSNFEVSNDQMLGTIVKYNGELTTLNVQSNINGVEIEKIDSYAFNGSKVENLILPDTCLTLDAYAFYNNDAIKTISGENVLQVGNYCFANNDSLETVELNNVFQIGVESFKGCSALNNVGLGSVMVINKNAFKDCVSLKDVIVPNCYSVQDGAFDNTNLNVLQLSGNMNYFGVMSNFHANKIITYLGTMFDYLYEEYADEVVDYSVSIVDEEVSRKVFKSSESTTLSYKFSGGYISNVQYSFVDVNNPNVGIEVDNKVTNINELTNEVTFNFDNLEVGNYEFYLIVTDIYNNSVKSSTVEFVVYPESQQAYKLQLSGENYKVYIDGQLAENGFNLYGGIDYQVEIVPYDGYMIDKIDVNGEEKTEEFTLSNVTGDVNISCETAEIKQFEIRFTIPDGVKVYVNDAEVSETVIVNRMDSLTFNVVSEEGYEISSLEINGVKQFIKSSYTLDDILENQEIVIAVEQVKVLINLNYGNGGVVSSQGNLHEVNYGENKVLTITPEDGYKIDKVLVNGSEVKVSNNTLVLENVTENLNVVVTFTPVSSNLLGSDEITIITFFSVFCGIFLILIISKVALHFYRKNKNKYKNHV